MSQTYVLDITCMQTLEFIKANRPSNA